MTDPKTATPEETQELLESGYTYIDVRSEPEFEAGHVPGALNVPISHRSPSGMTPNEDFVNVMEAAFPKDAELVVGCKAGSRSKKAVGLLQQAGFTNLVDMVAGFDGSRDAFGRPLPGWTGKSLPVETGTPEAQSYAAVRARRG